MTDRVALAALRAGVLAVLLGAVVVAALHLVGPGRRISPIRLTISEYGVTSVAWVFNAAVIVVAAGLGIILFVCLATVRRQAGRIVIAAVLAGLAVVGLVAVAVFAKQDWSVPMTLSGTVHRIGSLAAFIALPAAVITLVGRQVSRGSPGRRAAVTALVTALVGLAGFIPIVVAIVTVGQDGGWWLVVPLGLIERAIAVSELAGVIALAVWCAAARRAEAAGGERKASADRAAAAARAATKRTSMCS